MSKSTFVAACAFLVIALGSPVALQNILTALAFLIFLITLKNTSNFFRPFWWPHYIFAFGLLLIMVFATFVGQTKQDYSFLGGYGIWAFLPVLVCTWLQDGQRKEWFQEYQQKFFLLFVSLLSFLAIASLTQLIWDWKISGISIAPANEMRARALFSHPLTLAYVSLLFLPLTSICFFRSPRQLINIIAFVANVVLIVASMSKIVIALAFVLVLVNAFAYLSWRYRIVAISACMAFVMILAMIDNPIKRRFNQLITGGDRNTEAYVDDRFVFWEVHLAMIQEKPWLGHGMNITSSYREAYYSNLGLDHFPKKYEAHNTYLQIATQVGLIGLAFWLSWIAYQLYLAVKLCRIHFNLGIMVIEALVLFLIASVFQNSFQDAEVRYVITILAICAAMLHVNRIAQDERSS